MCLPLLRGSNSTLIPSCHLCTTHLRQKLLLKTHILPAVRLQRPSSSPALTHSCETMHSSFCSEFSHAPWSLRRASSSMMLHSVCTHAFFCFRLPVLFLALISFSTEDSFSHEFKPSWCAVFLGLGSAHPSIPHRDPQRMYYPYTHTPSHLQNDTTLQTAEAWLQVEASQCGELMLSVTFFRSNYAKVFYMVHMLRSPIPPEQKFLTTTLVEHIVCYVPKNHLKALIQGIRGQNRRGILIHTDLFLLACIEQFWRVTHKHTHIIHNITRLRLAYPLRCRGY
jgi:hypothetical protein